MTSVQTNTMTTGQYLVCCPRLSHQEIVYGMHEACDLVYAMHQESGSYAWCEDYLGDTIMEYGDITEGIAELVFS